MCVRGADRRSDVTEQNAVVVRLLGKTSFLLIQTHKRTALTASTSTTANGSHGDTKRLLCESLFEVRRTGSQVKRCRMRRRQRGVEEKRGEQRRREEKKAEGSRGEDRR